MSDWSSDVCSSDLPRRPHRLQARRAGHRTGPQGDHPALGGAPARRRCRISPGAAPMSRSRREYASLALAAAGLVALVVVAVLVFQTGEDKSEPRGLAEPNPATAPAGELATRPDDETAAMSLHDAPRELPDVHFMDGSGKRPSLADFPGKLVLPNLWRSEEGRVGKGGVRTVKSRWSPCQ